MSKSSLFPFFYFLFPFFLLSDSIRSEKKQYLSVYAEYADNILLYNIVCRAVEKIEGGIPDMWNKSKQQGDAAAKKSSVDLSDVVRGMQHAVNEAQKTLEAHNLKSLLRFFYEDGDPKTIDLHLKDDKHLEIPLVALANHNSLRIENLTMEFEALIEQVGISDVDDLRDALKKSNSLDGKDLDDSDETNNPAVFSIGFSGQPHSNMLKVKIEFASASQPEGLSRIVDEYNKLVVPYTAAEGSDNSPWKGHDN